ncbi:MAG: DUF3300 domain-containing protein [Acidobacteriota bacterium]|nr:DUF3300 domain-containing protein [Acidobacteriota bacterium]
MKLVNRSKLMQAAAVLAGGLFLVIPGMQRAALAQDYSAPPSFSPRQLDSLVSRVALYPDPLLAQVFAAASFPDQITDAARWANQYQNLHGNELADAIYQANLQFDPAVQALIPFPAVLDTMARDMNWTSQLGEAVLSDRDDVMDAVQRMRRSADEYGYLQSNQQMRVVNSGYGIEIEPTDPSLIYVPVYDPYVVYAPPRPGFFLGGAIRVGSCYSIGAFSGWGWGGGFNWNNHSVFVNRAVWGRTWDNRAAYVHNYGNWDRGEWRNNYSNRNVTVYNNRTAYQNQNQNVNRYSNTVQQAPVVQNRNYNVDRNYSRNNGGQFSNGYSNQGNGYRGVQAPPAAPVVNTYQQNQNRDTYRNTYNNPGMYRGAQSAPVAPVAAAPVTQNRTFERNSYSNPVSNNAPAATVQGRGFGDVRAAQGRMEHNGGGRR